MSPFPSTRSYMRGHVVGPLQVEVHEGPITTVSLEGGCKMANPGKYFIKVDKPADVVRAWLFNYEVNGTEPKAEHKALLDKVIGPTIQESGTLKLLGLASTTGTDAYNRRLSEQRCEQIVRHLRG